MVPKPPCISGQLDDQRMISKKKKTCLLQSLSEVTSHMLNFDAPGAAKSTTVSKIFFFSFVKSNSPSHARITEPNRGHKQRQQVAPLQPNDPTTLIPGLKIVPNFISTQEEEELLSVRFHLHCSFNCLLPFPPPLKAINDQAWNEDLKRKTQQYGYKFEHASQNVRSFLGPLPAWLQRETNRLVERGLYPLMPDQVIINNYVPGQGINPHVDKTHCFDGVVGSLGLGSSCIMQFRHSEAPYECIDVFFARYCCMLQFCPLFSLIVVLQTHGCGVDRRLSLHMDARDRA